MTSAKVFLDYTQAELDRAYDQRAWAPNAAAVIARYRARSDAVRRRLPCKADIPYGTADDETLDLFPAAGGAAPLLVFIHGGAWRALGKQDSAFAAETFVRAGAAYAALDFALLPQVRLPEMVDQVRRAILWLHANAATLGADPERIHICGHSSGAHLAAVMLTTDWAGFGAPATILKGGLCVSGMYDLHPVLLSARSAYVRLTAAEIDALSPIRHLDRLRAPLVVAYGAGESPEFKRQADDFAAALHARGHPSEPLVIDGDNHFEVIETLIDAESPLARAALRMMGLAA